MKKIILLISFILMIPLNASALEYPDLHYSSAIVYDLTDEKVLYELNSTEQKSIASLTKLVTIITAIENTEDLNKVITYDANMKNNVAWYASVAGFQVGDQLSFYDLLYAAMLPSGADATVALAISTSGSIENFVIKMNELAQKIGMTDSNFVNVHGLDEENHYSTAADIKKLLTYALKNEIFKTVYTTKTYTLSTNKVIKSTVQKQADKYNLDLSKIRGSKTGFTGDAGLCISVLMTHQDHDIIFITLGANTTTGIPYNISDSTTLIDFIETNYANQIVVEKEALIKNIPVKNSKTENYSIKTTKEITLFLENDYNKDDIKVEYTGLNTLSYKNKLNEKIGQLTYYYQNKEITSEDIYLTIELRPDILKIVNSRLIEITTAILLLITTSIIIFSKTRKKKL